MNLFKKIASLVMVFAFATTAFASSTNESPTIPTVAVTDVSLSNASWSSSVNVDAGDKVAFQLHYYLQEGESAQNMRFSMDNLSGKVFNAGTQGSVSGKVTASNLNTANGSVNINVRDKVRFELYNVSWQIVPCKSVGCEESLVDSHSKVLTSGGMSIGNVSGDDSHYAGNVIVEFRAVAVNDPVSYDNCTVNGITVAHGQSRTFYSKSDVAYGQSCSAYAQTRTCNDGNLSGSSAYTYGSCNVGNKPADVDATVSTQSAINVDEDSATLRGNLDINDWNTARVFFEWGTSPSSLSNTTSEVSRTSDSNFSQTITGLNDNTTYYYRAAARNPSTGEKVYGSVLNFRTDDDNNNGGNNNNDDVDVLTRSATNVDDDSARLQGELTGGNNIDVYFAFDDDDDTTPSCASASQRVSVSGTFDGGEDFSRTVTGLDRNEDYFYRACAIDEDGDIVSGSIRSFTTNDDDDDDNNNGDADVRTLSATNVDEDSARLQGEVEDGDNIDVWFAFDDDTDTTPSCASSAQRVNVSGTFDDGEDFSRTVTGLRENEDYFYRACAEDEDGDIVSGSIRSFTTDDDDDTTNSNPIFNPPIFNPPVSNPPITNTDARAVTNVVSGIGTNSARFNSIVLGRGNATCYFEYGRTTSLGLTSPRTLVDLDSDNNCTTLRTGLASNSTYYYRAVVEQNGQKFYGTTRNFRTNGTTVRPPVSQPPVTNPRVSTPLPSVDNENTVITVVTETEAGVEGIEITKLVSGEDDNRFDIETEAAPGETVYYKVKVTNTSDSDLNDVVVIDRIPFYLELDNSASLDDDDDKQVRWVISELEAGESRTFVTELRVREDARDGDSIESFASAETEEFSVNSNDVIIEVDEEEEEAPVVIGQSASVFGAGFFPDSLTGWGLLLLVILAIAYFISRILVSRTENQKVLAELHAARAARAQA